MNSAGPLNWLDVYHPGHDTRTPIQKMLDAMYAASRPSYFWQGLDTGFNQQVLNDVEAAAEQRLNRGSERWKSA